MNITFYSRNDILANNNSPKSPPKCFNRFSSDSKAREWMIPQHCRMQMCELRWRQHGCLFRSSRSLNCHINQQSKYEEQRWFVLNMNSRCFSPIFIIFSTDDIEYCGESDVHRWFIVQSQKKTLETLRTALESLSSYDVSVLKKGFFCKEGSKRNHDSTVFFELCYLNQAVE